MTTIIIDNEPQYLEGGPPGVFVPLAEVDALTAQLTRQLAALTAERDSLRAQISDLAALNAALISFVNGQITRAELDNQINSTTTGEHE